MLTDAQAKHYLFEISHEAELVERLFRRFEAAAERWLAAEHAETRDGRVIWSSIESEREMQEALEGVLSGFARVSLFVFPERNSGRRGQERAQRLRELLELREDHPVGDRKLRNHWMHLDHRLDEALEKTGEVPVGYQLALARSLSEDQKKRTFRLVDPVQAAVYIYGEAFHLRSIASAVAHVGQQAALAIVGKLDGGGQASEDAASASL